MNEFDDEWTDIFADLTPEDFATPTTSAFRVVQISVPAGEESFRVFVDEQLDTLRIGFTLSDGHLNPVATLANPTEERSFAPGDDETLREYLVRIKREAALMGATRFFFARVTQTASRAGDPDLSDVLVDPDTPDLELEDQMLWFAMRLENGERIHRQGYLTIVGTRLGDLVEGLPDQPFSIFEAILER